MNNGSGWTGPARAGMRPWQRSLAAGCAAWVLALGAGAALAQVSVTGSGSPSYGQAIAVPPGIGGMQPNLSLVYAGGGVNGPVGHGWSVQGISAITRCPATKYTDGGPKGVSFTAADKLCLDGQRLIQTDAGGAPLAFPQVDDARGLASGSREYRTEKDSFARIRAYGTTGATDANGPLYFKVWTKSGQLYEYGASPAADANTQAAVAAQGKTVIMVWAVARVSDVLGNYIDFKYEQRDMAWGSGPVAGSPTMGHEWNISEIQYTGNTSANQAPANKVIFRYSDRSLDRAEAYQQGSKNVSLRRLDGIDSYINSPNSTLLGAATGATKVRSTNLTYDNAGVTKRSRLATITECTGATTPVCEPPVRFNYANGGSEVFIANTAFNLTTMPLMGSTGTSGSITADFDGDGRTDLLYWSDTPSLNKLYRSNGDGSFTASATSNVGSLALFKSDGCYFSIDADFNGDGITDLLRLMRATSSTGASCGVVANQLLIGSSNGQFTAYTLPSTIDFTQRGSIYSAHYDCIDTLSLVQPLPQSQSQLLPESQSQLLSPSSADLIFCTQYSDTPSSGSRTSGANFHLIDVDGDGMLDIVTTILPAYSWAAPAVPPDDDTLCATTICTHVYKNDANYTFTELGATNLAHHTVYSDPPSAGRFVNQWRNPSVIDTNGDGLADLSVPSGNWLSRGSANGDFDLTGWAGSVACTGGVALDFNGDGRTDCLNAFSTAPQQSLSVAVGPSLGGITANFNLISAGQELAGGSITGPQTVGAVALDFNGDGRTDILRWKDDATQNKVYLSNGDGSFTESTTFTLVGSTYQLNKSDGTASMVLGDFLGNGTVQILRLKSNPTAGPATSNQLYVKSDPTPPDVLLSVISPTGLKTTLTYASLANAQAGRYVNDRGTSSASAYPIVDLTIATPVVITSETEVGVGADTVKTEFAYRGLKAAVDGRGMLGFRQNVQQNTAPNGEALTVFTEYLLDEPYAGVARRTETRKGTWSNPDAQLLSTVTNTYCDSTSLTAPNLASDAAPCASTAKVRRPYVYKTVETGADLGGNALPTVTTVNNYNNVGDPTNISVLTEGAFAGAQQQYLKVTVNTFCEPDTAGCPNKTSGDNWILGRLTSAMVTNAVPNLLGALVASPGTAANATAVAGNFGTQAATLSASLPYGNVNVGSGNTLAATLTNTGNMALTLTVPSAASVSGVDFSFSSTTCTASLAVGASCTVSVAFNPSSAVLRSGTLNVSTGAGAKTATLSGTGTQQVATLSASLDFASVNVGSGNTLAATLTNTGNMALSMTVPSAASVTGTDFSFSSTSCTASLAVGASCTVSVAFNPSSAVLRSGTLNVSTGAGAKTATLSGTGTQQVATLSASLDFASVNVGSSSTVAATLTNSGNMAVSLTVPSATSVSGVDFSFSSTTCTVSLAVGASCTVSVAFNPSSAVLRNGTLSVTTGAGTKTASLSGTGTQQAATLSASLPYGNVNVGSSSTLAATLTNSGNMALSLTVPSAASVSGVDFSFSSTTCTASLAVGASCTVSVAFNPSSPVARSGTLSLSTGAGTKSASLSGTGTQQAATLITPLAYGNVNVGSGSTLAATLTNTGNMVLSLTVPSAASVTGTDFFFSSTTCTASLAVGASCTVSVAFNPSAAVARSGTLSLSTGAGTKSASLSGTGTQQAATLSTSLAYGNVNVGSGSTLAATLTNSGNMALSMTVPSAASVSGVDFSFSSTTCTASLAVGASCTVSVAFNPSAAVARSGTLSVSTGAGTKTASLSGTGTQQAATLSASLAYGNVNVGSGSTLAATLTNTGNMALSLTVPSAASVSGVDFSFSSTTCTASLAVGASCTVSVAFNPSSAVLRNGTLSVSTGAGTKTASLSGTGMQQAATLDGSLPYGDVNVGSGSTLAATLTNTGNMALSMTVPSMTSVTGTDFSFSSTTCTASLAVGASCAVNVVFSPSSPVARSGTLSVGTGAGIKTSSLSGTGTQQAATLGASLTYGNVNVGSGSTLAATLTNSGNMALSMTVPSAASVSGVDFSFSSTTCTASLAVGASCTVSVAFNPSSAVLRNGTLSVSTGAGTKTTALSGNGTQQAATLSGPLDYGSVNVGASSTVAATLTNSGNMALSMTVPSAASVTGTDFSFSSTTCTASLAVGASCTVSVAFNPTAAAARSGTLSVSTGAGTKTASLSGTGVQASGIFSVVAGFRSGPTALTMVANTGAGTITGISASCQNTGFSGSSLSTTTLAPGASLTVTSYDGQTSGTTYCKVLLTGTNASNSPYYSPFY